MDDDRLTKRRAYEAAQTFHRAYRERFYPQVTLGGRPAEPVTEEVLVELARLEQASDAARREWEAARRPLPSAGDVQVTTHVEVVTPDAAPADRGA
ncbi:MAG: hypothetical protein O2822_05115 [Chloroflexi bacterium]|nr:hypothetical protein [Chloroflexota bacterium]